MILDNLDFLGFWFWCLGGPAISGFPGLCFSWGLLICVFGFSMNLGLVVCWGWRSTEFRVFVLFCFLGFWCTFGFMRGCLVVLDCDACAWLIVIRVLVFVFWLDGCAWGFAF